MYHCSVEIGYTNTGWPASPTSFILQLQASSMEKKKNVAIYKLQAGAWWLIMVSRWVLV